MMESDTITNCLLDEKSQKRYGATEDPHLEGGQRPPVRTRSRMMSFLGIMFTLLTSSQMALCLLITKLLGNYHPFMISVWQFSGNLFIIPLVIYHRCWKKELIFKPVLPVNTHAKRITALLLLIQCIAWVGGSMLEFVAVQYVDVSDSSTIVYSSPVFVAIVSHLVLGEKFGVFPLLCGLMTLCGVVVVTRPPMLTGAEAYDTDTLIGTSMAAGALLSCIWSYVGLRRLRNIHYTVITLFVSTFGLIQSSLMALAISRFELPRNLHDWALFGALMLFSFTPQLCLTLAFRFEEAGTVSLFRSFDIVFAFVWQFLILGVVPDWISLLGGGIVILGVVLASLRKIVTELHDNHPMKKRLRFVLK